nr:phytochrome B [Tanacetum cinerariifolium]
MSKIVRSLTHQITKAICTTEGAIEIVIVDVDIEKITLNEYLMYEAKQRDSTWSYTSRKRGGCSKGAPVAPDTDPILDELLEEFGNELLYITVVDEEVDCNPTRDIKELERLLAKDTQSHFTEIKDTTTRRRKFEITLPHG